MNARNDCPPLPGFGASLGGARRVPASGSGGGGGGGQRMPFEPPFSSVGNCGRAPVTGSLLSNHHLCTCKKPTGPIFSIGSEQAATTPMHNYVIKNRERL